jgi:hypothetical protein
VKSGGAREFSHLAAFTSADAQRLARSLAGTRKIGRTRRGFKSYCPRCSPEGIAKNRPNLSIAADNGRPLLWCFGCNADFNVLVRTLVEANLLPNLFTESSESFYAVTCLRAAMAESRWSGTRKRTELAILEALISIALRCAKRTFGASVREVAELARVRHSTAWDALRRLAGAGWIVRVDRGRDRKAATWRLSTPTSSTSLKSAAREGQPTTAGTSSETDRDGEAVPVGPYSHEIFWRKGLGPATGQVYALLQKPQTAVSVAKSLGFRNVRNARVHIVRLVAEELVDRLPDGRYSRTNTNLDDVADRLHVRGEDALRREAHRKQRQAFSRKMEWLERYRQTGEIVDDFTGEFIAVDRTPYRAISLRGLRLRVEAKIRARNHLRYLHGCAFGSLC